MSKASVIAAINAALTEAQALPDDTPAPAPTISNAAVTPATLPFGGGTVTISADVANATEVALNSVVVVLPVTFTVTADAMWVLTATGPGGTASAGLSVDVADAPPVPVTTLESMPVDRSKLVIFEQWSPDLSRYTRAQGIKRLSGPAAKLRIYGYAGAPRPLSAPSYALLVDGVEVATVAPGGAWWADFTLNADALSPGWHEVRAVPSVVGESCLPYFVLVVRGADAGGSTWTPVATASYSLEMVSASPYVFGKAPAVYAPTPRPLAPRPRIEFSDVATASVLHADQLVPVRFGDSHRVCKTDDGALTSFSTQNYHWQHFVGVYPRFPLLDGPRGIGTVGAVTHLEVGTAAPPSIGWVGNTYFCDPWRFGKVRHDGTVVTLAGWRHKSIAAHWQNASPINPDMLELVGDWSAIPPERWGFRELWGMAWDRRRNVQDPSGIPSSDPRERGLVPHPPGMGQLVFLADSQHDRIVRLEFDPASHFTPPKVTEHIVGISDPWDVVSDNGVLYVSERKSHRICAYDMDTGAFLRVVVQGHPLATIDINREVITSGTLLDRRAAPCVAPEGLFIQDGYLYFGSKAQAQIRRVPLAGGAVEVYLDFATDGNTKFCKFALSDGTFGPRGMVAMAMWTNLDYGWPRFRMPNPAGGVVGWELGDWSGLNRLSGPRGHFTYVTAACFGAGQMIFGGVNEGLVRVTRRQPGDVQYSAAATAGMREWEERGLKLLHGHAGFGFYGLPIPWGESANVDAFLLQQGHTQ